MGSLAAVGLTDLEEAVYEELTGRSSATIGDLGDAMSLSTRRLATVVRGLVEAGLVTQTTGRPPRYVVSSPEQAIETLARGVEEAVSRARLHAVELTRKARAAAEQREPAELIEVVEGDAIAVRAEQLERAARRLVRTLDKPPYLLEAGGENRNEPAKLAGGVQYHAIYDRSLLEEPRHVDRIRRCVRDGEQARTLADLPLKMMIVDDDIAIVPLISAAADQAPVSVFIRPSVLLDSMVAMFEALWVRSVPLQAGFLPQEVGDMDPDATEILGLLALGMKDEAIARHLGVHVRTVRRRIRAAFDALGVENRFQAGARYQDGLRAT